MPNIESWLISMFGDAIVKSGSAGVYHTNLPDGIESSVVGT